MSLVLDRKSHVNGLWNGVASVGNRCPPMSFVSQGTNRVQPRRATGWQNACQYSDGNRPQSHPHHHQRIYLSRDLKEIIDLLIKDLAPRHPAQAVLDFVDVVHEQQANGHTGSTADQAQSQSVRKKDAITSIQIKLYDYNNSDEVVKRLRAAFPPGAVTVSTWEAKQGLLLSAVEVETAILNVLLFMIIAVAGFGILAIFFMIVVEKTRDIGILKSLGASSKGVMSIFLSYGLGLGLVGSAAGVAIGLLFVHYINEIEDGLSWVTGRKVFDEKIYYFFEIPTQVNPLMVMWVALGAIAIAVLASVLPARRASRLHPVRALRYE